MKNRKEDLEKIIETLEKKVHSIIAEDREGQFLINHRGAIITVIFNDGSELSGELSDMDKNRVLLIIDGVEYAYYKHAVKGYYKK